MTNSPAHPLVVHVVSHTHWDREWYQPASRFRQRLVALIDALLDDDADREPFLLDGQTIVLEDYLAVRPERRDMLAARLRDGSFEAGPWYVLADELIPSAESLVRNLFAGRAQLAQFGATAPHVLYSPDAFGHPAAFPAIAAGFGMPLIVLWRGYGGTSHPGGDVARWRAPDGSSALIYHLAPDGYELGVALPSDANAARERWMTLRAILSPRSATGQVLLPNGADHHARQPDRLRAVQALASAATEAHGDRVVIASLASFAQAVQEAASTTDVPMIAGELRDSYGYTWALQGTFASRSRLKRRAAMAERALLRDAEPWAALADWMRGSHQAPHVRAAWKTLLQCQPHDTICGCSIDAVASAMSARLDDVDAQTAGLRTDALNALVEHDEAAARNDPSGWHSSLVLRNPSARTQRGVVAGLSIDTAPQRVLVGPGSAVSPAGTPISLDGTFTLGDGRIPIQHLGCERVHDRIESPQHYPWNDTVSRTTAVMWVDSIDGYATQSYPVTSGATPSMLTLAEQVRAGELWMENATLRIVVGADGAVALTVRESGRTIPSLVMFESTADLGDLYTPSLRGVPNAGEYLGAKLVHRGPLRATLELRYRTGAADELPISLTLTLDAGAPYLSVDIRGVNNRRDHCVRLHLRTGIASGVVYADAAFGAIRRDPITAPAGASEKPPTTAPLARYVTIDSVAAGATIYSDGLGEYESLRDGSVALTILRAVGELSRNDLPERPGHAGWPASTPAAQEPGDFEGRFAFYPHGARDAATIDAIERVSDRVLHQVIGYTLRAALETPPPTHGATLHGEGLAMSAIKSSEDGVWLVLRCVNLNESAVTGAWELGASIREARFARLDETAGDAAAFSENRIEFVAAPRAIVTLLVR